MRPLSSRQSDLEHSRQFVTAKQKFGLRQRDNGRRKLLGFPPNWRPERQAGLI